jgi:hypothetical protein
MSADCEYELLNGDGTLWIVLLWLDSQRFGDRS